MKKRNDSLDKYYRSIELFEKLSSVLYWLLFILSLITLYINGDYINYILSAAFILLTLLFSIANNYLKIYLIPRAENKRRVHLLSNSLGVSLDNEKTNGYYNNSINPSFLRLGANIFENSLFAKSVVSRMLIKERIKITSYILLFLLSMLYRGANLSAVAIVAQTLFSGEVICKWLYMECLKNENEKIFEGLHHLFLSYSDGRKNEFIAQIIDYLVKYESVKAYCGIKQSSKIFFQINSEVSQEWEEIKKKLKIDKHMKS
ncbi:hypothetical protein SDC9_93076 [bioreactor metagenome]|uniref:Uncharacterized protein n=1 Tax=bioreactor metagenome TaxID=1076179 RepID=A0A645A012_9ZZZZ